MAMLQQTAAAPAPDSFQTTWPILYTPTATMIQHAIGSARRPAPTTLFHVYEDEIWRQSFLCGRASRVEQFASGSSSRGQFTLF